MNNLTALIRTQIITHKNETFQQKLTTLSSRDNTLWHITRLFKNQTNTLTHNNINYVTDIEKAETKADAFEHAHITDNNNTSEQQQITYYKKREKYTAHNYK